MSLEFDRTAYGNDHLISQAAPSGGVLFSVWTRLPADWTAWGHNMDTFVLRGSNWNLRCLVGNVTADLQTYNANTMLFNKKVDDFAMWAGDYSFYMNTRPEFGHVLSPSQMTGWVWVAWQVVVGTDAITIRQWLKFGPAAPVVAAGESVVTFAALRNFLLDPKNNDWFYNTTSGQSRLTSASDIQAWVPSDAQTFQIGRDHSNLWKARLDARSAKPSLADLEALAAGTEPVTTAWGAWNLEWSNSAPDFADRSGHNHELSLPAGGVLYPAQTAPTLQ